VQARNHLNSYMNRNSFFLVVILLVMGCEKESEPLTTNSAIHTTATVWNDYAENIQITARGPYGDKSILVNSFSDYQYIEGLGNGTYNVSYSKDGYGTIEVQDIQLFGGDTVHISQVVLYKKPPKFTTPELMRAYIGYPYGGNDKFMCVETKFKEEDRPNLQMIFFISTSPEVDWNRYNSYFESSSAVYNTSSTWTAFVPFERYAMSVFKPGDHLYFRGYACNDSDPGYFDYYHGLQVFPTMDKSRRTNVVDFILP
jgi:hypothetical protein